MGRTAGSTSSTSKRPQAARSEPQASGVEGESKRPQAPRSEPQASEVEQEAQRAPASAPNGVTVGRVIGVHGSRGELRVRLLEKTDNPLQAGTSIWLAREEGDPKPVEARVRAVDSGRRGEARLVLEGVESRDAAETLCGRIVRARAEHLEPLPAGEYYQYELVGCRVEDGGGRVLGVVSGIWETGAPDLLVVVDERDGGREHLIPAARGILRTVDLEAKRIVLDVPPGLLDADPDRGGEVEGDEIPGIGEDET